ncbi:hypothetical protein AV530_017086 [Patagioenas fasciata monilis]|uniref:Uncharacterized protein n=1 Tax=Patagioenas fasciata monilis TaxID=372326 RepID=A0A1V4J4Z5_PATFA|nr:hypothetical protein AV530_017086 [Patagioenas fasciata monilis]
MLITHPKVLKKTVFDLFRTTLVIWHFTALFGALAAIPQSPKPVLPVFYDRRDKGDTQKLLNKVCIFCEATACEKACARQK